MLEIYVISATNSFWQPSKKVKAYERARSSSCNTFILILFVTNNLHVVRDLYDSKDTI